ncbi:MAG: hypothetical protein VR72_11395 [Clostridiaceae bacterium BRH_c20a]|nr:MAG: hypothetical protein VR72_11395 [Clostridiaceae bacterium BRH_c20a]
MERISLGFRILKENLWLGWVALAFNFFVFFIELITKSLPLVPPGFHLKFAMPNGIPEMSSILQQPQVQGININLSSIALIISPFLVGGFLSAIYRLLENKKTDKEIFIEDSKHFFLRLLSINVIIFLLMLASMLLLVFPPLVIVAIIFFVYLTYFWQLALVKDDLEILEALNKGKTVFKNNLSPVLGQMFTVAIISAIVGVPLNIMGQSVIGYGLAIIIWSFVGIGLSISIISLYDDLSNEKPPELTL